MDHRRRVGDGTPGPGRPRGPRNKLGEAFLSDLLVAWEQHGRDAINRVVEEKPEQFLKVVASLMPRDVNIKIDPLSDLSDKQLVERISQLDAVIRPLLDAAGADDDAAEDRPATSH
jgi:hypothetical protein